jgi:hypothetical protein
MQDKNPNNPTGVLLDAQSRPRSHAHDSGEAQGTSWDSGMYRRRPVRQKLRGQATIVIWLSMLVLILMIGLAIDGGSMFNQRRVAQNSSDAAALAAAREMLSDSQYGFDNMVLHNPVDVDGDPTLDARINLTITNYANLHGVTRNNLEAYYVNADKQIVSNVQVGQLGYVPWASGGAKGITVRNRAETGSFFMKLIGWDNVGARASSTAFMGVAVDSGTGVPAIPVGLFTDTQHLNDLTLGQTYTLIDGDTQQGSGNWGWINFNGSGISASTVGAWLDCGFDPRIATDAEWNQYCPAERNVNDAMGPTLHYQCDDHPDCRTPVALTNPIYVPYMKWGPGDQGWWMLGSSGTAMSNCHDLETYVVNGKHYVLPVFDYIDNSHNGSNIRYHLIGLAKFKIVNASVQCNYNPPTPTPVPTPQPTATPQPNSHWTVAGIYEGLYVSGASGGPGDLRHTSLRTVYLDN